jgi:hypothetical protein
MLLHASGTWGVAWQASREKGPAFVLSASHRKYRTFSTFAHGGSHGRSAGEPPFTMRKEGLGLAR